MTLSHMKMSDGKPPCLLSADDGRSAIQSATWPPYQLYCGMYRGKLLDVHVIHIESFSGARTASPMKRTGRKQDISDRQHLEHWTSPTSTVSIVRAAFGVSAPPSSFILKYLILQSKRVYSRLSYLSLVSSSWLLDHYCYYYS